LGLKFSVQEHLVPGRTLSEKWALVSDMGYAGLELRGGAGFADRLPELRAAARDGVVMASVCLISDRFIGAFDAETRAEAIGIMKELLSVIAEIGGQGAITPAAFGLHSDRLPPFKAPRSAEEDRAILLDALGQLGEHAGREGATVWLEPLNRYEDHMVNTLAQGAEICRTLAQPAVRLMADFFHMNIEEAHIASSLRQAGELVGHVHLADSQRLEPGQGHTDFAAGFAALDEMAFDGFGALECRLSGEPEASLRKTLEVLETARG